MKALLTSYGELSLPNLKKSIQVRAAGKLKYDPTDVVPDWSVTQAFTEKDATILMIPLKIADPILGVTRTFVDGKECMEAVQVYSKLLVKKNASRQMLGVIITYLPDRKYIEEYDFNINKLGYELGGTNYSGIYMVSSLDGTLIHGAKFDKGELLFRFYPNWRKDIQKGNECKHSDFAGHETHEHAASRAKYKLNIELLDARHNVLYRSIRTESDNFICSSCGKNAMDCECFIIDANRICSVCHGKIINGNCLCCFICHNYPCTCWGGGGNIGSGGYPPSSGNTGSVGGGGVSSSTGSVFTQAQIKSAAKKAVSQVLSDHNNDKITAHCNEGVRNAFYVLFNSKDLYNMRANDMVKYWKNNPSKWEKIEMKNAQKYANDGHFVVAGWINTKGSGHVVVIVPGEEVVRKWNGIPNVKIPNSMDTGVNMRKESQPINKSFGSDKHSDVIFFKYK